MIPKRLFNTGNKIEAYDISQNPKDNLTKFTALQFTYFEKLLFIL